MREEEEEEEKQGEHISAKGERARAYESRILRTRATKTPRHDIVSYLDVKHFHGFVTGSAAAMPVPARPGTADTEVHVVRLVRNHHPHSATLLDQPARLRAPTRAVRPRHHQAIVSY